MVNTITGVSAQPLQGSGQVVQSAPSAPDTFVDDHRQTGPRLEVDTRHAAFARLAGSKDDAAQVAQTVREVTDALEHAQALVGAMREQVQILVKNYPPFPPGSEQRLQYLNSISALRQQLEAMNIPPLESGVEPVLYPREADLPELDPERATDVEIVQFGQSLDTLAQRIGIGLEQLQTLVRNLPDWGQAGLPQPPESDTQATTLSRETATQLPRYALPLMGGGEGLTQIGG